MPVNSKPFAPGRAAPVLDSHSIHVFGSVRLGQENDANEFAEAAYEPCLLLSASADSASL
jgi:hypothetical protein